MPAQRDDFVGIKNMDMLLGTFRVFISLGRWQARQHGGGEDSTCSTARRCQRRQRHFLVGLLVAFEFAEGEHLQPHFLELGTSTQIGQVNHKRTLHDSPTQATYQHDGGLRCTTGRQQVINH
jgi:hypothetical protein